MKSCPICHDEIPDQTTVQVDDLGHCVVCGRRFELRNETPSEPTATATQPAIEFELSASEHRRMDEVRRLRSIAYGPPSRTIQATKMKGLLALMIIVCLLVYAYIWDRHRRSQQPVSSRDQVTHRAFNALFGPSSSLSPDEKIDEFRHFRSMKVRWKGVVSYVNEGVEEDLYIILRHPLSPSASDVLLRFNETHRGEVAGFEGRGVGPLHRSGHRIRPWHRVHYGSGGAIASLRLLAQFDLDGRMKRVYLFTSVRN